MEKKCESIYGIEIFEWQDWDEIDVKFLQFYNIKFEFESMKQFNGCDCSLKADGYIEISSEIVEERTDNFVPTKVVWEGYAIQIPEYKQILFDKFK